jgi:LAS superfamily LD-carboxypeptidase LdcB
VALLCPLPAAAGKYLRADAAYAFSRMSQAYAAAFGSPICVTSAYRSYDDQVRVSAERPGLAAKPGYSNHGWGTAADLCGGIDRFGTATHDWMLANAPLFGWFHPAWAEPSGKLPEPWHWEFGG